MMTPKNAREIYFNNFGNYQTMKRNGEYRDYCKSKVSHEVEYQWGVELKNNLVDDIVNKGDLLKVVPLSRVNLPENEIIESFKKIAHICPNFEIKQTLERLNTLISPDIYKKVIDLFTDKENRGFGTIHQTK